MSELFKYGAPSFRKGRKLKKTEIGEIPEDWEVVKFLKSLDKNFKFKVGELKQKDYQKTGQYPIVDQSEELISGYSDKKEKVYQGDLPVIIFGDHTRVIKYVDFPFIVGGSGVKILRPNENFNIKCFYYLLLNLNIESRGYNRHFKILKEKLIPKPLLPEQYEIVEILQTIDQKIEIEKKKKELYEELFKTMLNKIMSGKIRVENLNL
jgi:type I restriction enzyme S subunit